MTDRVRRPFALMLAGAALCVPAACSDDDGEDAKPSGAAATAPRTTKAAPPRGQVAAAYRREASRICRDAEREASKLDPPTTPEGMVGFLERGLAQSQQYLERLDALRPPPGLRRLYEEATRINDAGIRLTRSVLDRLEAGAEPTAALAEFSEKLVELANRSNANARRQGLPDCVVDPAPQSGPGPSPS